MRTLLARARADRADRAWRRRGLVVLCRAHCRKKFQGSRAQSQIAGGDSGRSNTKWTKTVLLDLVEAKEGNIDYQHRGENVGGSTLGVNPAGGWGCVAWRLCNLEEGGIFRAIAGYT